jgi:hypothetical protein
MKPYMLKMVQAIAKDDKDVRRTFCCYFVNWMVEDGDRYVTLCCVQ